jgi:uncharacterized protein (TIGR03790 family)
MKRSVSTSAATLAILVAGSLTSNATTPYDDVAVIVNTNSPTSIAIGSYFQTARSIPSGNMVYIAVDTLEEIDGTSFDQLRFQVEDYLTSHELINAINYLVTTKGVPLKINRGDPGSRTARSASVESELMLILGSCSSSIGGPGMVTSPYFYQTAHFSRSAYGIYLVTRLDAYSLDDVYDLIDRSGPHLIAGSSSSFVLDQDPDWNSSMPALNDYLVCARTTLEGKGKNVTLDSSTTYLTHQSSVIGYVSWGSNDHHADTYTTHAIPHNTWAKGALAETYVSTSGRTFTAAANDGQSLVADLAAEGVSGVKGYVYEPYSNAMAIAYVLFDRYTSGYNLAESFGMASRFTSWMGVIIGDPKTSIDGRPETPLALQPAHFEAKPLENTDAVRITWGVPPDTSSAGFYVQRRGLSTPTFADLPGSFVPERSGTLDAHEYSWTEEHLSAGTYYYRLRQLDHDGTTHVSDSISVTIDVIAGIEGEQLPRQLALSQNYPNPFNPTTTIEYSTPGTGRVTLKVFNALGQEISTLVDEIQREGSHAVRFSGAGRNAKLASGTYFYRIEANHQVMTRKMVLLQ